MKPELPAQPLKPLNGMLPGAKWMSQVVVRLQVCIMMLIRARALSAFAESGKHACVRHEPSGRAIGGVHNDAYRK